MLQKRRIKSGEKEKEIEREREREREEERKKERVVCEIENNKRSI